MNSYRYRLFEKLGVKGDVELAIMAIQHELVDLGAQKGDQARTADTSPNRKGPVATRSGADLMGYDSQHSTEHRGTS